MSSIPPHRSTYLTSISQHTVNAANVPVHSSSKTLTSGGSPSNPSSRHFPTTSSYTRRESFVLGENSSIHLNSLHALMMHLEPQGRISGGFWLGSRYVLHVSLRKSMDSVGRERVTMAQTTCDSWVGSTSSSTTTTYFVK